MPIERAGAPTRLRLPNESRAADSREPETDIRPNAWGREPGAQSESVDGSPSWVVEVFFDGGCPLCRREMTWVRRLDRHGRVLLSDIAGEHFRPKDGEPDIMALMAQIHGRLPDGRWIVGVEVFRRIYEAVGWGFLVWPTRLPGIRSLLDRAYNRFARARFERVVRSGRVSCALPPVETSKTLERAP